jgi:hypothetical protein
MGLVVVEAMLQDLDMLDNQASSSFVIQHKKEKKK